MGVPGGGDLAGGDGEILIMTFRTFSGIQVLTMKKGTFELFDGCILDTSNSMEDSLFLFVTTVLQ